MGHIIGELARPDVKAFTLDTRLPTPTGWVTVGQVKVGDALFDEHGEVVTVTLATEITTFRTAQRFTFDDGADLVAHSGNLWTLMNSGRRIRTRAFVQDWREHWSIAERVRGTSAEVRAKIGKCRSSNFSAPLMRPLGLPPATLPLPPYVLGAWLGDGCKDTATMTTTDPWMLDEFRRQGMVVTERKARPDGSTDFGFRPDDGQTGFVTRSGRGKTSLREAGVLGAKFIPAAYLRASRDQRLALLRGILDTDGWISQGGEACIEQRDESIAAGVQELGRSLGWRAFRTRQSRPHPHRPGETYRYWHVSIRTDVCPFALPRKVETWTTRHRWNKRFTHRTLTQVEPVTRRRLRGIAVNSQSGLLLAGDGMVPA